jgi:hypothetical protein
METTQTHSDQIPPNIVAVMYAPAALLASGWLPGLLAYSSDSLELVLVAGMAWLCGLVMAPPMVVLALYRAIRVDTRPLIWGAALVDAGVIVASGLVLLVASR